MSNRFKLSVMMFLEFFIWGAWFPLIFGYLPSMGFSGLEQTLIVSTFNVAALVALFFSTQFVDRNFAAEKFLAFSQFVGGAAILGLFFIEKPADGPAPFWPFFGLLLAHCLFYVPTISITNSIAFTNVDDPQKDFGPVRLWGTIGWIAAAWPMALFLINWDAVNKANPEGFVNWARTVLSTPLMGDAAIKATSYIFVVAGVASLLLAGFSLVLPHTPPKPATEGRESLAWLEAMKFLRIPFILVLFIVTFFDSAIHQCYFFWTARYLENGVGIAPPWIMPIMSIGQVAEIVTLAFLAFVLKSLGWRMTMVIGILGHAVRFAVFAYFPEPLPAITVNVLHGICYAFFFATVYIFIDEYFPKDARASTQGLFNVLILGVGPFLGNFVWQRLGEVFEVGGKVDFKSLFLVPAGVAVFAALLLLFFFHPPARAETAQGMPAEPEPLSHTRPGGTGIKAVDTRVES
jgi:nucleoside transporter